MNKNRIFWLIALLAGCLMAGCATSKNADMPAISAVGTIDACKVKKPPENQDVLIVGDKFVYPNVLNLSADYTGCVKRWIGDNEKHPPPYNYFIFSAKEFKNGHVVKVENYELDFSGRTNKVDEVCHYHENGELIAEKSAKDCHVNNVYTIEDEKKLYLQLKKIDEEYSKYK